jgi:alcohol dehydrogenase class IV
MTTDRELPVPTRVVVADGCVNRLPAVAAELGAHRAVLVTGRTFAVSSGLAGRVTELLASVDIDATLFAEVAPDPNSGQVDACADLVRASGADLVVAVGGGSAIDVAKLGAALAAGGGSCDDLEAGRVAVSVSLPVIAIPTTAGSGSEATPYAVVSSLSTGRKFTATHESLHPFAALVDPTLTRGASRSVTLAPGLDAWVHALEASLSAAPSAPVAPLAARVLAAASVELPRALAEPHAMAPRRALAAAATTAGAVIAQSRTGLVHTASVALAPYVAVPHGLLNAILVPHVLAFNLPAYDGALAASAGAMGLACSDDEEALDGIRSWLADLGVPGSLGGALDAAALPGLVARVNRDAGLPAVNARPFADADLEELFSGVLELTGAVR